MIENVRQSMSTFFDKKNVLRLYSAFISYIMYAFSVS